MNTKEKAQLLANFYQELADNDNGFKYPDAIDSTVGGPTMDTTVNYQGKNVTITDLSKMSGISRQLIKSILGKRLACK